MRELPERQRQNGRSFELPDVLFYWCPRSESNQYLMITNQLHDLHATGADLTDEPRIIAEAAG